MTVLVTCGETRQSLSAVRAFGRARIPVALGSLRRPALAMWSRYASSTFLTRNPQEKAKLFAHQLAEELRGRYALLALASSNPAFWSLSRYRELLPVSARSILPPHYSVVRSLDHEALHHFAESLGITCASLIRIPGNSELKSIIDQISGLEYPLLIRPIIPWVEREESESICSDRFVAKSVRSLQNFLKNNSYFLQHGFLISTHKTLRAVSYFGVMDQGKIVVEGFQERLYEEEPYNEVATLAMTISPIDKLREMSKTLLMGLDWNGPFKVEFVRERGGRYKLISLIGRLWGSLQLALASGVNIPLICYRIAEGTLTQDLLVNSRPNVKMRWLIGDASSKLLNMGKFMKNLWHVSTDRSTRDLLGFKKGPKITTCYDVLDLQDPMPFLFELQHRTWRRALSGD